MAPPPQRMGTPMQAHTEMWKTFHVRLNFSNLIFCLPCLNTVGRVGEVLYERHEAPCSDQHGLVSFLPEHMHRLAACGPARPYTGEGLVDHDTGELPHVSWSTTRITRTASIPFSPAMVVWCKHLSSSGGRKLIARVGALPYCVGLCVAQSSHL